MATLANFSFGTETPYLTAASATCVDNTEGSAACASTREELDAHLYDIWYYANRTEQDYRVSRWGGSFASGAYLGAFDFQKWNLVAQEFAYTVLFNGSISPQQAQDNYEPEVPAMAARLHAALYKKLHPAAAEGHGIWAAKMGYPTKNTLLAGADFSAFIAPFFLPLVLSLVMILFAQLLVAEKAQRMREVMVMCGLQRGPYWMINWTYNMFIYLISMAFTIIFGYAAGFTFFSGVSPGVILVYYFLHGMALNSFSCFLSCFFANEKASSFFMILLLIIFVPIGAILGSNMITGEQLATAGANAAGLIPYFNLNLGVGMFAAASSKPDPFFFSGVRERYVDFSMIGIGGSLPVAAMMVMLLVDTILYTVLFVYLDMVLPVGPGVKKHPLFFLKPSFWVGGKGAKEAVDSCAKPPAAGEAVEITEERKRVVAGQEGGLLCLGLAKQYPGAKEPAVVNVQFGVKESECFGLLGSNGAGKSTTIHILCGLHEPSSGTVLCGREKLDIRHKLSVIQSAMGVCSQDNLLWDDLTGTEHLSFFCRIRQVRERRKHIEYWLKRVNLFSGSDRRKRSKAYSGGMKRRLSAKKQRSIILTTHALRRPRRSATASASW